jgi:DNA anti-recombination protein RmuC
VHIATPTTLVTMLRTAQYAWQQAALSDNARAVFDVGRELHERLAGLSRHVDRLGRTLTSAVTSYNQTVGSLENRVLVSARRFSQLGLVDAGLESPCPVEETTRAMSAPELIAEIAGPEFPASEVATPALPGAPQDGNVAPGQDLAHANGAARGAAADDRAEGDTMAG